MTTRAFTYITATMISIILWMLVIQAIVGDSQQKCEAVVSIDTCAWELR